MKSKLLYLLLLLCGIAAPSAHANLGESLNQVSARYGRPIKKLPDSSASIYLYQFNGRHIFVEFTDGKSVGETIRAPQTNPTFSDKQCLAMAALISGQTNWTELKRDTQSILWAAKDATASLQRQEGVPDHFIVTAMKPSAELPGARALRSPTARESGVILASNAGPREILYAVLANLLETNAPFTATAEFTLKEKGEPMKLKTKFYAQDGRFRIELDMRKIVWAQIPPGQGDRLAEMGLARMDVLLRTNVAFRQTLYPDRKAYHTTDLLASFGKYLTSSVGQLKRAEKPIERIGDQQCRKIELLVDDGKEEKALVEFWRDSEKGHPVQVRLGADVLIQFRDVKSTPIAPKLFEVPAGFKRYESVAAIASEALQQSR